MLDKSDSPPVHVPRGTSPSRPPWVGRFLLLAGIWGTSFLFIKVGDEGLDPYQVAFARLALGAATLMIAITVRRETLPRSRRTWAHLVLAGTLGNAAPFVLFAWGEQRVSSIVAGIWNGTTPLLTLLVAIALLPEERPTRQRVLGLAVGFAGVLVVLGPWNDLGGTALTGQLACLGAAACYGVTFPYVRRYLGDTGCSPVVLAGSQLLCASVVMAVAVGVVGRSAPSLPPRVVGSILGLGVLGTGVAYILSYALIRDVGATTTSSVTYVIPVVAAVLGVVFLGEHLAWNLPVGGLVVITGVAAAEGRLRRVAPA